MVHAVGSGRLESLEAPSALAFLEAAARWVAWRTEQQAASGKNGEPTGIYRKMPYNLRGRRAAANKPATWSTFDEAVRFAANLPRIDGLPGGVGIILGPIDDEHGLGGIDLDTCRDPKTGNIAEWAREIIERVGGYFEVSPSGTGAKGFFLYRIADLPDIRAALGAAEGKRVAAVWRQPGGERHAPAIELYVDGGQYFAVTGAALAGCEAQVAVLSPDTVRWLATVAGPARARAPGEPAAGARRATDKTRSGLAFGAACEALRRGTGFDEWVAALRGDQELASWVSEKGEPDNGRLLKTTWHAAQRAVENGGGGDGEIDSLVDEFNGRYFVALHAGKTRVYEPARDPLTRRVSYHAMSFADLRNAYLHKTIAIGAGPHGQPRIAPAAEIWLRHARRRTFLGGLVFDPSGGAAPDAFNLWQGFAVEPAPGSWHLLREHVRHVVCGGDGELFEYLLSWTATIVQRPASRGEVALVLKGGEGTGKGIFLRAIKHLLGQHGFAVNNAKHLIGNFNLHLRDCVFLFADEAFFAGDKQHIGTLKSLVTEPYLTIEGKGQDIVQTPNYLHIAMASNEEWVVPAALDARRFFVLNVSDERVGDFQYFTDIDNQMSHGGYEAMLFELLHRDIGKFNVRNFPNTDALGEQKKLSLPLEFAWWQDVLMRRYVFESKLGLSDIFSEWMEQISTNLLFASYSVFARERYERHPLSRETLGRFMRKIGGEPVRQSRAITGEELRRTISEDGFAATQAVPIEAERARGFAVGTLDEAREAFAAATGLEIEWGDDGGDAGDLAAMAERATQAAVYAADAL